MSNIMIATENEQRRSSSFLSAFFYLFFWLSALIQKSNPLSRLFRSLFTAFLDATLCTQSCATFRSNQHDHKSIQWGNEVRPVQNVQRASRVSKKQYPLGGSSALNSFSRTMQKVWIALFIDQLIFAFYRELNVLMCSLNVSCKYVLWMCSEGFQVSPPNPLISNLLLWRIFDANPPPLLPPFPHHAELTSSPDELTIELAIEMALEKDQFDSLTLLVVCKKLHSVT